MTQPISALAIIGRAKQNRRYAELLSTRPGYDSAVAMRNKAMERQRSLRFPMVTYPTPPDGVSGDLDTYLSDYTAAYEEEQSRNRQAEALIGVIGACERTIISATDDPDALLQLLSDDLDTFMARATGVVDRLHGASTATQAITSGVADVWRELPALRTEYDDIRQTQTLMMLGLDDNPRDHVSEHIDDPMASDLTFANMDDLIPGWRQTDTTYTVQGAPPDRRPWPSDPLEQLVWLVTGPAEVWIPTGSDLSRLHTERRHRIDPPFDGEPINLSRDYGPKQWGRTRPTAEIR